MVAQQPLHVAHAQVATAGGLGGRAHDIDLGGQGRGELRLAHPGQGIGHGGVRRQDDRVGIHQAAGGEVVVGEQAADVVGILRLHLREQLGLALRRKIAQEVGGVVGVHLLQHVDDAIGLHECDRSEEHTSELQSH